MVEVNLCDLIPIFDTVFPKFLLGTRRKSKMDIRFTTLNFSIHLQCVSQVKEKWNTV